MKSQRKAAGRAGVGLCPPPVPVAPGRRPGVFISAAAAAPRYRRSPGGAGGLCPGTATLQLPVPAPKISAAAGPGPPPVPAVILGTIRAFFSLRASAPRLASGVTPPPQRAAVTHGQRSPGGAGIPVFVGFSRFGNFWHRGGGGGGTRAGAPPAPRERGAAWAGPAPPRRGRCAAIGCAGDDVGALRRLRAAPVA